MVDLRYLEMMDAARVITETCMAIKDGEQVLILTDNYYSECKGGSALQNAIIAESNTMNAEVMILCMRARLGNHTEIPKVVAEAMKQADVVVTIPTEGLTHTDAAREAMEAGTRFVMLPCANDIGKEDDIIYNLLPRSKEEVMKLSELTMRLGNVLKDSSELHLLTSVGTDITLRIGSLKQFVCTGICDRPGMLQYVPTGQLAIGVDPNSANGEFVVDGSISPMGKPLDEPVKFAVKNGYIMEITGGREAVSYKQMMNTLGNPEIFNIAEVGFGTNPKAKITGNPLGDERLYGSAHIGFGSNLAFGGEISADGWHNDAVFTKVTLYADGKKIIEEGIFLI